MRRNEAISRERDRYFPLTLRRDGISSSPSSPSSRLTQTTLGVYRSLVRQHKIRPRSTITLYAQPPLIRSPVMRRNLNDVSLPSSLARARKYRLALISHVKSDSFPDSLSHKFREIIAPRKVRGKGGGTLAEYAILFSVTRRPIKRIGKIMPIRDISFGKHLYSTYIDLCSFRTQFNI